MRPTSRGPASARTRHRRDRRQQYLETALHLVTSDGVDGLTMQRLADAVGASVGSAYTYFPSKGALLAEVQRAAIDRLTTAAAAMAAALDATALDRAALDSAALDSAALDRTALDRTVPMAEDAPGPAERALIGVVAFGRFWATAGEVYPEEMQLLLQLLSGSPERMSLDEASVVVPSALSLLALAGERIERAAQLGALDRDEPADARTVALAAALTGCVQLDAVSRWDPRLLDASTVARTVLDALLRGWGAQPESLAVAHAHLDRFAAEGHLAGRAESPAASLAASPAVPPTDPRHQDPPT